MNLYQKIKKWLLTLYIKPGWYAPCGHRITRFWGSRNDDLSPVAMGTLLAQKCEECHKHWLLQECHYRRLK